MSKQLFLAQDFITNTSYANVYKVFEGDKNKIPCCNVKVSKSQIFANFGPMKFVTKLFHLTWEKKVKRRIGHGKSGKKKVNLGVLRMNIYISGGYPNHAWTQLMDVRRCLWYFYTCH
jgi:hypothetical protein